jgi:hypothetical protein
LVSKKIHYIISQFKKILIFAAPTSALLCAAFLLILPFLGISLP